MAGNIVSNAFASVTRMGKKVYRINLKNEEILGYLEEGKTHIAIDICCNGGRPRIIAGTSKTNGRAWEAMQYYVWATNPSEIAKVKGATNAISTGNVPIKQ